MENYISIYMMDYSVDAAGQLMQKVILEGQPIPAGWTTDRSSLVPDPKIEQDQINKNLTLQLAKANLEIAKLKSQIGGTK